MQGDGRIKIHPEQDVTVVQIAATTPQDTKGNFNSSPVNGVFAHQEGSFFPVPQDQCVLFTNVPDGNEVLVFGYPVELLSAQKLANETNIDFACPLIRRGIISQKSHRSGKLIIDAGVYGGNSGGPVILVRPPPHNVFGPAPQYDVVGIITEYVPYLVGVNTPAGNGAIAIHSGYGVVEPIDYALELMRQFP